MEHVTALFAFYERNVWNKEEELCWSFYSLLIIPGSCAGREYGIRISLRTGLTSRTVLFPCLAVWLSPPHMAGMAYSSAVKVMLSTLFSTRLSVRLCSSNYIYFFIFIIDGEIWGVRLMLWHSVYSDKYDSGSFKNWFVKFALEWIFSGWWSQLILCWIFLGGSCLDLNRWSGAIHP